VVEVGNFGASVLASVSRAVRSVKRDFSNLADARAWVFGEGRNERAKPGHVLDLKSKAGVSAFELSPAEIAEAAAAMKACREAGISLLEAVRFAIKHARPPGGSKSLQEAIDALIKTKTEAGRSGRHLRGSRWNLERSAAAQGKENGVHEVQRHSVESWLNAQSFSLKTRANYLRDLGSCSTLRFLAAGRLRTPAPLSRNHPNLSGKSPL
jgi:hypothetical protein